MPTQVSSRRRPPQNRPRPIVASASRPRPWIAPLSIVMVALLVRVVAVVWLGGHPLLQPRGGLDDAVYVNLARRVAAGDLALGPDVYYVSPLYAYFLGLIFAATGGSVFAARLVQAALGACAVGLIAQTATTWFGRRSGLIAGALAAVTGIVVFNELLVLQSSLDPFLTALSLFLLTRALHRNSWPSMFAAGAAFGALSLNRPNAMAVLGAIAVTWFLAVRTKRALAGSLALLLGAALLVAPVAIRNRVVAGEWVMITSHGGLNFYIGNSKRADGAYKSVPGVSPTIEGQKEDVRKVAAEALKRPVTANEASAYFYDRAWEWIRSHPADWARLLARKVLLTLHSADLALNYSYVYFTFDEPGILTVLLVGPWLIIPLGLLGLVVGAPRERRSAYLAWVVFVPAYAATLVAFFISSRYRLALLVPLLMGAGAGVNWLWDRVAAREWRRLAPAAVALSLMAAAFNVPIAAEDGRMFEREERAVRYIVDGQIEEGKRLIEEVEPLHANRATMLYRVGMAFRDRNDAANATIYLQRARRLNPHEPWIAFNLGEALLQNKRPADALPHLEAARAAGINATVVAYDIAGAYAELGQRDRARAELAAVRISPDLGGENLLQLGSAARELGDLPLAERFLREAVTRAPALASARQHLGVVLGMEGKPLEAVSQLEAAVSLAPSSVVSQFHLAVAYAQVGRLADAQAAARRTLQIDPNYAPARSLLAQLAR